MDPVSEMRKLAVLRLRETGRALDVSLGPARLWSVYQEGSEPSSFSVQTPTWPISAERHFPSSVLLSSISHLSWEYLFSLGHFSLTFEV